MRKVAGIASSGRMKWDGKREGWNEKKNTYLRVGLLYSSSRDVVLVVVVVILNRKSITFGGVRWDERKKKGGSIDWDR